MLSRLGRLALWLLGYPDQALQSSHEALTLAQELAHPYSLALCPDLAAMLHLFRRERQAVPKSGQRPCMALWTRAGVCAIPGVGHDPAGLGAGRSRGRGRRAWPRCARAWPPASHRGRGYGRIIWPCWPRRMGSGQPEEGLHVLAEALAAIQTTRGAFLGGGAPSAQG